MKTALALAVGLTLSATAISQPREIIRPISSTEIAWNWLLSLAQDEPMEPHLKAHGVTMQDPTKIKDFAKQAEKDRVSWWIKENDKLCNHRSKYENDAEKLAEWYERRDAAEEKEMQRILDKLPEAIGPADAISFQTAVVHHSEENTGISGKLDIPGMLRDGTVSPSAQLDSQCSVPEPVTQLEAE